MAQPSREQCVQALFNRLSDPTGPLFPLITTFSRAYKLPNQVQPEQQPALFLVTVEYELYNPSQNKLSGSSTPKPYSYPNAWIIRCNLILYFTQVADDPNPEGSLNTIIDAIEDCLNFKQGTDLNFGNNQDTNLGGLVEQVTFIDKQPIAIVVGTGSLQATVLVPLEMLMTQGRN